MYRLFPIASHTRLTQWITGWKLFFWCSSSGSHRTKMVSWFIEQHGAIFTQGKKNWLTQALIGGAGNQRSWWYVKDVRNVISTLLHVSTALQKKRGKKLWKKGSWIFFLSLFHVPYPKISNGIFEGKKLLWHSQLETIFQVSFVFFPLLHSSQTKLGKLGMNSGRNSLLTLENVRSLSFSLLRKAFRLSGVRVVTRSFSVGWD